MAFAVKQLRKQEGGIVRVKDGKVIEDGPHDELIAAGGEYAHLWSRQTGAYLE